MASTPKPQPIPDRYRRVTPALTVDGDELDTLAGPLDHYHLYHATRAELLRALGHPYQARLADERALELTQNPAERALLHQRITWP